MISFLLFAKVWGIIQKFLDTLYRKELHADQSLIKTSYQSSRAVFSVCLSVCPSVCPRQCVYGDYDSPWAWPPVDSPRFDGKRLHLVTITHKEYSERERGQRDHAADGWGGSGRGGGGVWGFFASVLWVYICLVSMCFVSKCRGIASTCQQYKSLLSADARKAYLFNTEKN